MFRQVMASWGLVASRSFEMMRDVEALQLKLRYGARGAPATIRSRCAPPMNHTAPKCAVRTPNSSNDALEDNKKAGVFLFRCQVRWKDLLTLITTTGTRIWHNRSRPTAAQSRGSERAMGSGPPPNSVSVLQVSRLHTIPISNDSAGMQRLRLLATWGPPLTQLRGRFPLTARTASLEQ